MKSLSFSDVTFGYSIQKPILKNINFEVYPSEILGIMGPNGSGKSTLMKLANGLLRPQSGLVLLNNGSISKEKTSHLAQEIIVLLQFTRKNFFMSTVEQELLITLKYHKKGLEQLSSLEQLLDKFQLESLRHYHPHILSGGEQRRLTLAIALASSATYFLFDEPTANLDQPNRLLLHNTLIELKKRGKGVVVVSHDVEFQLNLCDRLIILLEGEIKFNGTPYELITSYKTKNWNFFEIPEVFSFVENLERKMPYRNLLFDFMSLKTSTEKLTLLSNALEGK